jgi:hypothetical protein
LIEVPLGGCHDHSSGSYDYPKGILDLRKSKGDRN